MSSAVFYALEEERSSTSFNFFRLMIFTAYSFSVFLSTHYRITGAKQAYAVDFGEVALADHLANVIVILDLADFCHVPNIGYPGLPVLITGCEELAVVGRGELHAEAVITRSSTGLLVNPILISPTEFYGSTMAFSMETTVVGASEYMEE